ncbi:hypothetical protein Tco_1354556 [Tanacetum coccineum]
MPRKSSEDHKNTRAYIPMISHEYRTPIKEKLRDLESRYIHEGRVVFDNFADLNYVRSLFHFVEFECLLEINEQICPRFILEFYSQYRVSYSDEGQMFVEFVIQNQFFSYSLEEFAQILDIPCEGACVFTDRWRLDELAYGIPSDGPYQTNLPSIEDIISSIRIDRDGQVRRIRHEEEIDVLEYQVLTREIEPTLKPLDEIIQENGDSGDGVDGDVVVEGDGGDDRVFVEMVLVTNRSEGGGDDGDSDWEMQWLWYAAEEAAMVDLVAWWCRSDKDGVGWWLMVTRDSLSDIGEVRRSIFANEAKIGGSGDGVDSDVVVEGDGGDERVVYENGSVVRVVVKMVTTTGRWWGWRRRRDDDDNGCGVDRLVSVIVVRAQSELDVSCDSSRLRYAAGGGGDGGSGGVVV